MGISDFKEELRGMSGFLSEAATKCLLRYFRLLRAGKESLRSRLSEEDLIDIARAIGGIRLRGNFDADLRAIQEQLAGELSERCSKKLDRLSEVESMALLDAVERTQNMNKRLTRSMVGAKLLL